jgi:hypothetical protein
MVVRTAGELGTLSYVNEAAYGTIPVGALTWGCDIEELVPSTDMKANLMRVSSSRSAFEATRGAAEYGFRVKGYSRAAAGAYNWRNLWAYYGLGSLTGLADHLESFTAQAYLDTGATNYYKFYSGCKVNKLTISAEAAGEPWAFDAEIFARWHYQNTSKNVAGLQTVTVGASPDAQTGATLCWNGISYYNIGGGLVAWYPRNIKLTVDNKLQRQNGNVLGDDANYYSVPIGMAEGPRDIILEANLWYEDETWTAAKLAGTEVSAVAIPIGDQTISLQDGVLLGNDFPTLKHDLMDENVKIAFETLSIA